MPDPQAGQRPAWGPGVISSALPINGTMLNSGVATPKCTQTSYGRGLQGALLSRAATNNVSLPRSSKNLCSQGEFRQFFRASKFLPNLHPTPRRGEGPRRRAQRAQSNVGPSLPFWGRVGNLFDAPLSIPADSDGCGDAQKNNNGVEMWLCWRGRITLRARKLAVTLRCFRN